MGFKTVGEEQAFIMGAVLGGVPIPISDAPPAEPVEVAQHSETFAIGSELDWLEDRGQTISILYPTKLKYDYDYDGNGYIDDYYYDLVEWVAPIDYQVIEIKSLEELREVYNAEILY